MHGWKNAWIFLAPALALFAMVQLLPAVASLYLSLSEWEIVSPPSFVGLENFRRLIGDPDFWQSLWVTARIATALEIGNTTLGLLLALGLNQKLRGLGIYRTLYFMPLVTAWAAAALIWNYIYSTTGPINAVLSGIGVEPIPFLSVPETATWAVVATVIWKSLAWKTIILLAGLQAIPKELYEAAHVDGATRLQQFRRITLPLLTPSLFVAIIVGIINTLQIFDPIYIMTEGGPVGSTRTLGYYIYTVGFERLQMGYAASMSWVLFAIILAFTLVQWRLQRRWVFYR